MSDRTRRVQELMGGAWGAVEKGNWTDPVLGIQRAFIYSFEAIQELARELEDLTAMLDEVRAELAKFTGAASPPSEGTGD